MVLLAWPKLGILVELLIWEKGLLLPLWNYQINYIIQLKVQQQGVNA